MFLRGHKVFGARFYVDADFLQRMAHADCVGPLVFFDRSKQPQGHEESLSWKALSYLVRRDHLLQGMNRIRFSKRVHCDITISKMSLGLIDFIKLFRGSE